MYVLVAPVSERLSLVRDAQSALLYVANWHFLAQSGDYFAADVDKSPFLHFWSLAIEEQFYVVFPVLLLLLSRRGRRWVVRGARCSCAPPPWSRSWYWAQVDTDHAYYGTDARLYQLLAGSLLARRSSTGCSRWSPGSGAGRRRLRPRWPASCCCAAGWCRSSPSLRGLAATVAAVALVGGADAVRRGDRSPGCCRAGCPCSWGGSPTAPTCGTGR